MRILISLSFFFILNILALNGQNEVDSIPKEKNHVKASSKGGIIQRPQNLLPHSDTSLKPLQQRTVIAPEPDPKPQEQVVVSEGQISKSSFDDKAADPWSYQVSQRHLNRWFRDITGFRIFADYGGVIGFGNNSNHRLGLLGTFGYQFNPIFFLGVGQGYHISLNKKESSLPTFANLRVNFLDENTTPYMSLNGGYSFLEGKGVFLNPNFGMSFAKGKNAWNIGVGYVFQKANIKKYGVREDYKYHGISLNVAFEFSIFKFR